MVPEPLLTCKFWSGRRDSNPRPLDPQSSALPNCATSRNRPTASTLAVGTTLAQDGTRRVRPIPRESLMAEPFPA
jgi:hypothetical protein